MSSDVAKNDETHQEMSRFCHWYRIFCNDPLSKKYHKSFDNNGNIIVIEYISTHITANKVLIAMLLC